MEFSGYSTPISLSALRDKSQRGSFWGISILHECVSRPPLLTTIDLTQQIQISTASKQLGTTQLYNKRLELFKEFINNAGYELDIITSHHPILIAEYLRQVAIKEETEHPEQKPKYYSESH